MLDAGTWPGHAMSTFLYTLQCLQWFMWWTTYQQTPRTKRRKWFRTLDRLRLSTQTLTKHGNITKPQWSPRVYQMFQLFLYQLVMTSHDTLHERIWGLVPGRVVALSCRAAWNLQSFTTIDCFPCIIIETCDIAYEQFQYQMVNSWFYHHDPFMSLSVFAHLDRL